MYLRVFLLLLPTYKFFFLLECVVFASWKTPWKKILRIATGKRWWNKMRLFSHSVHKRKKGKIRVKRNSSEWDWGQCSLEELCEWEQERAKENCEGYTVRKRVVSEKKLCVFFFFFFAQVVFLSVVISI